MSNSKYSEDTVYLIRKDLEREIKELLSAADRKMQLLIFISPEEQEIVDNEIKETFGLQIEEVEEHLRIKLPAMKHRKSKYHLPYLNTLKNWLNDYKDNENYKTPECASVIYEHMVKPIPRSLLDNDNYSVTESKDIMDSLVYSELIKSDRGTQCFISHISTLTEEEPCTYVHVIDMDNEKWMDIENLIKSRSIRTNNKR